MSVVLQFCLGSVPRKSRYRTFILGVNMTPHAMSDPGFLNEDDLKVAMTACLGVRPTKASITQRSTSNSPKMRTIHTGKAGFIAPLHHS